MNEDRITMTVEEAYGYMTDGQRRHMFNLLKKRGYDLGDVTKDGVNSKLGRGATLPGSRKPHG